jgi:hypothetical protein
MSYGFESEASSQIGYVIQSFDLHVLIQQSYRMRTRRLERRPRTLPLRKASQVGDYWPCRIFSSVPWPPSRPEAIDRKPEGYDPPSPPHTKLKLHACLRRILEGFLRCVGYIRFVSFPRKRSHKAKPLCEDRFFEQDRLSLLGSRVGYDL